jgi:glucose/arabinose dehydrogenase
VRRTVKRVIYATATLGLAAAIGVVVEGQAKPAGDGPLKSYLIRPGDLPPPGDGTANPPQIVPRPAGAELHLPPGFTIGVFAEGGFKTLRWAMEGPGGDIFVTDTTANTITLLRDADKDGKAESRHKFVAGLNRPMGMAIQGGYFYVGNTDSIVRWKYTAGQTSLTGTPQTIAKVPAGGNHWTRTLAFSPDGTKLYVTVGSKSNVDAEPAPRASILEMNPDGTGLHEFAAGLRNAVGLTFRPGTSELWAGVHERDMLGDDLVPDYVTHVLPGAFYGWPYAYIGPNEDPRRKGEKPDLVAKTIVPDVLLQSHSAPLGLTFYSGTQFPADYRGDAFLALHGSWNRKLRTGYKVVRIPIRDGKPTGGYEDFITGWSLGEDKSEVWGRPVAIVAREDGSLLITDDAQNLIWRVTYRAQ